MGIVPRLAELEQEVSLDQKLKKRPMEELALARQPKLSRAKKRNAQVIDFFISVDIFI